MPEGSVQDQPKLFKDIAPAEVHDRGWIKPFLDKPYTPELGVELAKKLDGAETLIGRKIGIPGADAKPEEIEKFYATMRPAKPEDYEFKVGENADAEFLKAVRTAAHKASLDKRQLSAFVDGLVPEMQVRQKAAQEAQAKLDQEFENLVKTTYAQDNEAVVSRVKDALVEHVPENLKPFISTLDNKALAVVVGAVNAIMVKYMSEDQLKSKGTGSDRSADKAALQAEARKLMLEPGFKNFQHPDHEKINKRIAEIYAHPAFK